MNTRRHLVAAHGKGSPVQNKAPPISLHLNIVANTFACGGNASGN